MAGVSKKRVSRPIPCGQATETPDGCNRKIPAPWPCAKRGDPSEMSVRFHDFVRTLLVTYGLVDAIEIALGDLEGDHELALQTVELARSSC